MKTESCRRCGQELSIFERCETCQAPSVLECKNCEILTQKQFHANCVSA